MPTSWDCTGAQVNTLEGVVDLQRSLMKQHLDKMDTLKVRTLKLEAVGTLKACAGPR